MNNTINVGINGFGRIGRLATRIILDNPFLRLTAINSRAQVSSHAYLLKYDSTYGTIKNDINAKDNFLYIDSAKINVFNFDNPDSIPWNKAEVDIVIDATGKFRTSSDLISHLKTGPKYVILSSPAKDNTKTFVYGVNNHAFDPKKDKIISNSSCTTNCLSTTLKVIHDNFNVLNGFMTTVHAVTDSQNLFDNSHKKEVRLRRSSFLSMIPSATGSANDINKLFPELSGKINCQAIRIPLPTVSMIILTVNLKKSATAEEINDSYKEASNKNLKNILAVSHDELVSKDFTGSPYSSIIDLHLTKTQGNMANIYSWYDNEWGYTSRLVDMVEYIGKKAGII